MCRHLFTGAVLFAVLEFSLIDATGVILLGLNRGLGLGKSWRSKAAVQTEGQDNCQCSRGVWRIACHGALALSAVFRPTGPSVAVSNCNECT